jgi:hypothetical protein
MSRKRRTGIGCEAQEKERKIQTTGHASKRVVINVSGDTYETYALTLLRFPDSLLGDPDKMAPYFCNKTRQYFFARNRQCFGAILYLYQSPGRLTCPPGVPVDIFEEECRFFELPDKSIRHMRAKEGILTLDKNTTEFKKGMSTWRHFIWNIVENPETSYGARVFAINSTLAILFSTLCVVLKTLSFFDYLPWNTIEFVLNCWFLFELIARFLMSPTKKKFMTNNLNWLDAISVVPLFLMSLFLKHDEQHHLHFLQPLRVIRVMRLFRLSRHSKRLKIVGEIARQSLEDLQMLVACLSILVVFYASVMFYVENEIRFVLIQDTDIGRKTDFDSIPISLWWGITTVTTVGYGDIIPITLTGKVLSAVFMACGALTLSLPVMSIVTKFLTIYVKNVENETNWGGAV